MKIRVPWYIPNKRSIPLTLSLVNRNSHCSMYISSISVQYTLQIAKVQTPFQWETLATRLKDCAHRNIITRVIQLKQTRTIIRYLVNIKHFTSHHKISQISAAY